MPFLYDPDPTVTSPPTGENSLLQGYDLDMLKKQLAEDNAPPPAPKPVAPATNGAKQPDAHSPGLHISQQPQQRGGAHEQPNKNVHTIKEHQDYEDSENTRGEEKPHVPDAEEDYDPHERQGRKNFARSIVAAVFDSALDFNEEHPRDKLGEFTTKDGKESTSAHHVGTTVYKQTLPDGKVVSERRTSDGKPLPEHIQALKIPPAWTDVTYSPNPKADLLATGKDVKGRKQAVYSKDFSDRQAQIKFARVNELNDKYDEIYKQNEQDRKSSNPKIKAAADCAYLIMKMGIRPGSDDDTGADKKAYGATNLEGRHVVVDGNKTSLVFTGKKGVDLNLPVTDPNVAKMLRARKQAAGDSGRLFNINEKNLLDNVHTLDGGSFKSKDLRTRLACVTAAEEMKNHPAPKNEKEYKKAVNEVGDKVSKILGNTRAICLQSYINGAIFAGWRMSAGV
jgi:DNA topoisomerase I